MHIVVARSDDFLSEPASFIREEKEEEAGDIVDECEVERQETGIEGKKEVANNK